MSKNFPTEDGRRKPLTLLEPPSLVRSTLPLLPQRHGRARVRVPVIAQVQAVLCAFEEYPAVRESEDSVRWRAEFMHVPER